jgi:hypothetical protein
MIAQGMEEDSNSVYKVSSIKNPSMYISMLWECFLDYLLRI